MKKNEIFTFTAHNGVEVTGVALYAVTLFDDNDYIGNVWFCYGQNRLFTIREFANGDYSYQDKIVEYCIIPDYDEFIQLHSSMEYPQWEQNLEAEIQGMNDR